MNGIAQLSIDKSQGRIFVHYEGEQIADVALASKYHITSKIKHGGFAHLGITDVQEIKAPKRAMSTMQIVNAAAGNVTPIVNKFPVNQRFDMKRI